MEVLNLIIGILMIVYAFYYIRTDEIREPIGFFTLLLLSVLAGVNLHVYIAIILA